MRVRKRLLMSGKTAVYHVMSRTAFRSLRFGDDEKEIFTRMLFQQARFAGIDVLGYCVMGNHVHLLLRVPPVQSLPDGVLLERYRQYYGAQKTPRSTFSPAELDEILKAGGSWAEAARRRVLARMGDLPAFMRELKQRFTIWYNQKHDNIGTIWAARYKSLLVEDSAESLTRLAAYLDLNPVRAKLVEDPKDYRWCGYAAALGGNRLMRYAVVDIFKDGLDFATALQSYRIILFGRGFSKTGRGAPDASTIPTERLEAVLKAGASVSVSELFRMRVRYFTDGIALGSKAFLESVFLDHRGLFGSTRMSAGTALSGEFWGELHAMRSLKKSVYS